MPSVYFTLQLIGLRRLSKEQLSFKTLSVFIRAIVHSSNPGLVEIWTPKHLCRIIIPPFYSSVWRYFNVTRHCRGQQQINYSFKTRRPIKLIEEFSYNLPMIHYLACLLLGWYCSDFHYDRPVKINRLSYSELQAFQAGQPINNL